MNNWVKLLEDTKEKLYEYNWNAQTQELCLGILDTALSIPLCADTSSSLYVILSLLRLLGADTDVRFLVRMKELECKLIRISENCTNSDLTQDEDSPSEESENDIKRDSSTRIFRGERTVINRHKMQYRDNNNKLYYIDTITEYSDGTKETEREYVDYDNEDVPLYNHISKKLIEGDGGNESDEV